MSIYNWGNIVINFTLDKSIKRLVKAQKYFLSKANFFISKLTKSSEIISKLHVI